MMELSNWRAQVLLPLVNCADGFYAVDTDQKIIAWNKAAETILGYCAADVLGKHCYEVLEGRDGAGNLICQSQCPDMRLAKDHDIVPSRDVCMATRNRQLVWVNVTNIVAYSEYESLICVAHVFRDVTAAKRLEELGERLDTLLAEYGVHRESTTGAPRIRPVLEGRLSQREREVLVMLATGASAQRVAKSLVISPLTARKHIQNILAKLNAHSVREAVALAIETSSAAR